MQKSNIDFFRLLFALLVIVTHSYPLTGLPEEDLLFDLTGGEMVFSYVSVRGFFVLSGYLIFKSLMRSDGLMDYFWKRSLRIFPAYWVLILLTVFLIAPLVADISVREYFAQASTWYYLKGTLTMQQIFEIDHVLKDVPFEKAINGSLWTIPYEFLMYCLIAPLYFIRNRKSTILIMLTTILVGLLLLFWFPVSQVQSYHEPIWGFRGNYLVDLGVYFLLGAFAELIGFKGGKWGWPILIASTAGFIVFSLTGGLYYLKVFLIPAWVLSISFMSFPVLREVRKAGDFSYGIYLYAFLIQQLLMHFFHLNHIALTFTSIPISILAGVLSWHLIEKHALRLKDWKWWRRNQGAAN